MTSEQIQEYLDALVRDILDKGVATPEFRLEFNSNRSPNGYASYKISTAGDHKYEYFFGTDPLDILQQMKLHVMSLKTKDERELEEYLKKVASAVEYGRKIGIDQDFINPLVEQMRRLSSNIIEHKPRIDDEIPF